MIINILIAEDDTILALFLKSLLIDLGYAGNSIKLANTGRSAVSQAKEIKPQLVFMDIRMESDRDGISASLAIRQIDPSISIVFVSAYPEAVLKTELENITYADYLEKPFNGNSIAACLKRLGLFSQNP
jgi:CheY-like chemotaxis protein